MKVIVVLTNAKVKFKNNLNVYCSGNFDVCMCVSFFSISNQSSFQFDMYNSTKNWSYGVLHQGCDRKIMRSNSEFWA